MGQLFLTLAEVIDIHNNQIKRYGGAPGRDGKSGLTWRRP